jgi:hypothetical protein
VDDGVVLIHFGRRIPCRDFEEALILKMRSLEPFQSIRSVRI